MARRIYPNCLVLWPMQKYSSRGWVYREDQGWVFDRLTPDERAEFKSYQCGKGGITTARMRVRVPYNQPRIIVRPELQELDEFTNWFALCTMPWAPPLVLSRFQLHQNTEEEPTRYQVELGGYETGLWADEVKFCREIGCEVTIHHGYGWLEWGIPNDWKPPLTGPLRHPRPRSAEYTFIYALVDEMTQKVGYIGRSDHPERRFLEHLRDTNNPAKWAWIQSLSAQGRQPKLLILEKVAVSEEGKREQYWISYYQVQGHDLMNIMPPEIIYIPIGVPRNSMRDEEKNSSG